jgi:hypothetical protein
MKPQKIKLELELTPEIAFFLSLYLNSTVQGDYWLQNSSSKKGKKIIHKIAQSIMDQITEKTDFENIRIRSLLTSLKKGRIEDKDIPDELDNILN